MMGDERWLATSRIPDQSFVDHVATILRKRQPAGMANVTRPANQQCALRGSLDHVLSALGERLHTDYLDHLAEKDVPYQVDYVVTAEDVGDWAIRVLTRLYSPLKPGQIFYGPTVLREDESTYSLWLDPD